jgi:hypothetical protein
MAAQLALYESRTPSVAPQRRPRAARAPLCASCRAREARYGFKSAADDPTVDRPRTLCFECFRVEMARRQESARAVQVRLPLERTLETLHRRRRRAQIAARRALGLR